MYAVEMIVVMPNGEPTNGKSDKHKKRWKDWRSTMKTPEEMAEEFAKGMAQRDISMRGTSHREESCLRIGFLAGYQAALDQHRVASIVQELEARRFVDDENSELFQKNCELRVQLEAAAPQWISVKDRLPNSTPMVLAMCIDGYELAYYGNYGKGQWTNTLGTEYLNVTHWMLLPEPPTE
jgi:hypothetical protein